jgi:hypothetical protein
MSSCEEAEFYLNECGQTKLDLDHDAFHVSRFVDNLTVQRRLSATL